MTSGIVLILVVAAAYLAAHAAFEWLGRRFRIVSGAEYLLLGILLGPSVSGVISPSTVGGFAPFMTLALGWIGAVVGAQFHLPNLIRLPSTLFKVAFAEALLALALASAAMGAVLVWLVGETPMGAVLPAVTLGAMAVASAPAGVALVSKRPGWGGPVVRQLQVATAVDALVAIVAFGLLLSILHLPVPVRPRAPTATEWAVISVGIGVVGGALFHLFLGGERSIDRLFIGLAGALILTSGAAAYLRLSPLLPCMLVGMILVNTSTSRAEIMEVLGRVERPLYFVLLIFAGAAWVPGTGAWLLPVLAFLIVRPAAKVVGAAAAGAVGGAWSTLGPGWGRALLGQGGLAVAISLDYRLHGDPVFQNLVFTAAIVSVLLTDLASARLVESVVRPFRRGRLESFYASRDRRSPGGGEG